MGRWVGGIHMFTGLWFLAGLIVMGINGYALVSLFNEPLSGYSQGVRIVNAGLQQYRALLNTEAEKITAGMDLLASRFETNVTAEKEKLVTLTLNSPRQPKKILKVPTVVLPTLTGIIMSQSTNGTTGRRALMDGKVCCEGDRVKDFTIKRISAQGVSVTRGSNRWFLKAPDIGFSLTPR